VREAADIEWVVHVEPPFGVPQRVLKYLARYTHRVAISNYRLSALENGRVSFDWKDYAHQSRTKVMNLDAVEFIRRMEFVYLLDRATGAFISGAAFVDGVSWATQFGRLEPCTNILIPTDIFSTVP